MKRIIFFLICPVLLFSGCATQKINSTAMNEVYATTSAGVTHIKGGKSYNPKMGAAVGAEMKILETDKKSSVRAGINVSLQGANYTESYSPEYIGHILKSSAAENEYSGKVSLTYLNMPILYHYIGISGFYGEIGIQPSLLLNAKDKPDGESGYDYNDFIKTFDFGIPVGAGFQINEQLSIGARAVFGLPNINTEGNEMYSSDDTDRNFVLFGVIRYNLVKE